jgi:hypothetical protein
MKAHTQTLKNNLKSLGRQLRSVIEINGMEFVDELYSVTPIVEANLLKSVMKSIKLETSQYLPEGTKFNYRLGVMIDNQGNYEYLNFGNYNVYEITKKEDKKTYEVTAYDDMLYAMKDYKQFNTTYPITIKDYLQALANNIGLEYEDTTFVNQDQYINEELYLNFDDDGNAISIGYTYRDVLDEIAQVVAGNIIINQNGKLQVAYLNDTQEVFDEEFIKDTNVNFGEKFGPVNSIVITRVEGADSIYRQDTESIEQNGLCELKIQDNQILNKNNRELFIDAIYNQLLGLQYYVNDYSSTGICVLDTLDKYTISIGEQNYQCIMLNDEIDITSGLTEKIYAERLDNNTTNYKKADKKDIRINQTYIIADKQNQVIQSVVAQIGDRSGKETTITQDLENIVTSVQNSGGGNLLLNSVMFDHGKDDNDNVIASNWTITGSGTIDIEASAEAVNYGSLSGNVFRLKNMLVKQRVNVKVSGQYEQPTYYTFSTILKKNNTGTCYCKIYNENEEYYVCRRNSGQQDEWRSYSTGPLLPTMNYYDIEFYGDADSNATFTDNMFSVGEYQTKWQQASGEIMNTLVVINLDGMTIKSARNEGDYTRISPMEFAGYSYVDGILTRVFSLNKDTTEVEKLKVRKEIDMPPFKIVPIVSTNKTGWAWVKID